MAAPTTAAYVKKTLANLEPSTHGPLSALDQEQRRKMDEEVDEIIENHDDAIYEGDTVEEWRALDERLAASAVGRLLQELREISGKLLDHGFDPADDD